MTRAISRFSLLIAFAVAVISSGCIITVDPDDIETIQGSGLLETQTLEVHDFSRVSMSIPGDLYILQGTENALTIDAQANLLPYLEIFVEDERLHIETDDDIQIRPTRDITVWLTVASLNDLVFAGTGFAQVDSLITSNFSVTLAGSGDISIHALTAVDFEILLAGSGDIFMTGIVDEQSINLAGSGDIDGRDLDSKSATVEIAGSGSATLRVSEQLRVSIIGSGSVRYLGNPVVETTIVGSGTVQPLEGQ